MSVKSIQRHSASTGPGNPNVTGLYDPDTGSIQYVVSCPETKQAVIIDPVLDFEPRAAKTSTANAEALLRIVEAGGLSVAQILDTHPHADHITASSWLKERLGVPNAIGQKVEDIAVLWRGFYNMPSLAPSDHYDRLLRDGDTFEIGGLGVSVILSPGHTLGSITYKIGDAAFVHDTLMHVDSGTSRADFPGGSAADLWESIETILQMPDATRLFVGHDYCPGGREPMWESTVADQRTGNTHVGGGVTREAYIDLRETRDATLKFPDRMLVALQMNLRAGLAPEPEEDGNSYLKIPLNRTFA